MGSFSIFNWLAMLILVLVPLALITLVVVLARRSSRAGGATGQWLVGQTVKPPVEARLQVLADLKAKGLISDEEYAAQRAAILREV